MFSIGSVIGSFLNVCIYRLPRNESIVTPPSYCFQCNTPLTAWDLIPLVSYLVLGGKCRYCGKPYSSRYAMVELLVGLLFFWCFLCFGAGIELIKVLLLTSFLVIIAFIDYDHQLILDKVLVWFAGTGVAAKLYTGYPLIGDMLLAAVTGGGILLFLAIITRGGMGDGDIKFIAALGLWLGLEPILLTLFLAFVLGGLSSALLLLFKLKTRKDFIPFAPFIAIAGFISALYGVELIQWYFQGLL